MKTSHSCNRLWPATLSAVGLALVVLATLATYSPARAQTPAAAPNARVMMYDDQGQRVEQTREVGSATRSYGI